MIFLTIIQEIDQHWGEEIRVLLVSIGIAVLLWGVGHLGD